MSLWADDHTAEAIIERLRGGDGLCNGTMALFVNAHYPPKDWTLDDIDLMIDAASFNTTITEFVLCGVLEELDHITVVPFLKLIENSTTLKKIAIGRMVPAVLPGSEKEKQHRMIIGMIFHAMIRNKEFPLTDLSINCSVDGNHDLLHRFLISSKIENLNIGSEVSISSENAWALSVGLRSSNTLKHACFRFSCNSQASLNHIIVSLQNHPMIEKVCWSGVFHYEAYSGLLTLCTSCPKIKDVAITPTNYPEYSITPLLHGLRFSDTLESLELYNVLVGNMSYLHSPHLGTTIQRLELHNVTFEDNSVSILRHFTGLKKLSFSHCTGVSAQMHQNLSAFLELEELNFDFGNYGEEERNNFIANITQIMSRGPQRISFRTGEGINITKQFVSRIIAGLRLRQKPMTKFGFKFSYYALCEKGAISLFRTNALPLLSEVEDLSIDFLNVFTRLPGIRDEALSLIKALSALERLKNLSRIYNPVKDRGIAKAILKLVKENEMIEDIGDLDFADDLQTLEDRVYMFLYWNSRGRRLIRDRNVPLGFWPHLLAKIDNDKEDLGNYKLDVMFQFAKSLNTRVNLFKKS